MLSPIDHNAQYTPLYLVQHFRFGLGYGFNCVNKGHPPLNICASYHREVLCCPDR